MLGHPRWPRKPKPISTAQRLVQVQTKLAGWLPPQRYAHSIATAKLCAALAPSVAVSPSRVYLAGLLHDCARELSLARLQSLLLNYHGRYAESATRENPGLWHNPAGVYLAQHVFRVSDPGILRAIALHSTGAPAMRPLDQLLYVADFCEPKRRYRQAAFIRHLAQRNLPAAVKAVLQAKLIYLRKKHIQPHPRTQAMARSYGLVGSSKRELISANQTIGMS